MTGYALCVVSEESHAPVGRSQAMDDCHKGRSHTPNIAEEKTVEGRGQDACYTRSEKKNVLHVALCISNSHYADLSYCSFWRTVKKVKKEKKHKKKKERKVKCVSSGPVQISKFLNDKKSDKYSMITGKKIKMKVKKTKKDKQRDKNRAELLDFLNSTFRAELELGILEPDGAGAGDAGARAELELGMLEPGGAGAGDARAGRSWSWGC
ncbi:UNVERIFIED_CONTAM: hypothetical protein FKN15_052059 [Acipenser sinensis]